MARGLENLLSKIDENPRQTLVGRYLALIADIKNEDERAEHALALAERLVVSKTNEALRISHMVYESGRHQVRALRVVIACFEQKGRAGKVAVLKLELEKLERELSGVDASAREASINLPAFKMEDLEVSEAEPLRDVAGFGAGAPAAEDMFRQTRKDETRVADLDFASDGEGMTGDENASYAVDLLFQDVQDQEAPKAEDQGLDLAEGVIARLRGRPGDTVLPPGASFPGGEKRSETMISHVDFGDVSANPQRTVKLDDMPRVTLEEPRRGHGAMQDSIAPPPANALSSARGTAPSEIFDRFFAAGKYVEAEVVLESSRSDEHFEWWQLRRLKLDVARQGASVSKSEPCVELDPRTSEELPRAFEGDFRKGIMTEVLSLADSQQVRRDLHSGHSPSEGREVSVIPLRLLAALRSLPHEASADEAQLFEVLQGLFPGGGNDQVLHLLQEKSLETRSPAWFGFYLDTLMACGYARKVIAESALLMAKWSSEGPAPLEWVRVMWQRLPKAWQCLGSDGFIWREEDGTRQFALLINKRPRYHIKHFL